MAPLEWDQPGEKFYQSGIDRGVLYLHDGTVAVWNGLISVEESPKSDLKSYYLEGVKYLENLTPGEFVGKLKAYTYPEEFDQVNGMATVAPGMTLHEQPPKSFNLSYRTGIGNDVEGTDRGYIIHILYNIVANPETMAYETADSDVQAVEFSWTLTGIPPKIKKFRPTVHVSVDSLRTPPEILKVLEGELYGTATTDPFLPPIQDVAEIFGYLGALIIIDHGDGTWTAIDESEAYITMLDSTTFQLDQVDAVYLDAVTYDVSSTNVGGGL